MSDYQHTPLGYIEQDGLGRWTAHLEIAPPTEGGEPGEFVYAQVFARDKEQLLKRMAAEARFNMNLLGTMLHRFEEKRRRGEL